MPTAITIDTVDNVGPDEAAVEALAARSAPAGHASALNEAGLLNLRHPRADVRHLLARTDGDLVGYAQLELGRDGDAGQSDPGQSDPPVGPASRTPASRTPASRTPASRTPGN